MTTEKTIFRLLTQANELRRQRDFKGALKLYYELKEMTPLNINIYREIASCHFALDEFDDATYWIEKAVEAAPNDSNLHADLARYCVYGNPDYERAASEYRLTIQLNPNNEKALLGGAALYGVPEDVVSLEEATGWLERATQVDPLYHFRLGKFYGEANRLADRNREWQLALLCTAPLENGAVEAILRKWPEIR